MNVYHYTLTEQGKRPNNEDAVISMHLGPGTYFFAVADGMGGVKGGEVASKLVLKNAQDYLKAHFSSQFVTSDSLKSVLRGVYDRAHESIKNYISEHPDHSGMGTTLTSILIYGDAVVWANIGDSRLYLVDNDKIQKLTRDHTLLEDAKGDVEINSPYFISKYKHVLTKAVDGTFSEADYYPENKEFEVLKKDSTWFLCSDGLIPDDDSNDPCSFLQLFNQHSSLNSLGNKLVASALDKGSTDNISVILIKITDKPDIPAFSTLRIELGKTPRKNKKKALVLGIVSVLLIFVLAYHLFFSDGLSFQWLKDLLQLTRKALINLFDKVTGIFQYIFAKDIS